MITGLDTEIPDNMKVLQAMTVAVLQKVETEGICRFEYDDGKESVETVMQLEEISGDVGYYFFRDSSHIVFVVNDDKVPCVSPGRQL